VVARPPLKALVEPMRQKDLPAVHEIERRSFTTPWPAHAYRTEIESNRLAHYRVVRLDGRVVAYAGIWLMVDEAHVTTFAVDPAYRRRGVGERLLLAMLDLAIDKGAREATLEVRLSNTAARSLYEKYGFRPVGIRPNYYSDDNEDALIMTTDALDDRRMRSRLAELRASIAAADLGADDTDDIDEADDAPGGGPGGTGPR
jgi:[ribosomal protein S18]-alanine N-acetyltransferase